MKHWYTIDELFVVNKLMYFTPFTSTFYMKDWSFVEDLFGI